MKAMKESLIPVPRTQGELETLSKHHPVCRRQYTLCTPQIEAATRRVLMRVAKRAPNCSFCGAPRVGKTSAQRLIIGAIRDEFPQCLVKLHIAGDSKTPRVRGLVEELISQDTGLQADIKGIRLPKLYLARNWAADAISQGANHLVLVIDEANRLTDEEFTWLADLMNLIERIGVRVTFVTFGSAQFVNVRTALLAVGRHDLVSRFSARVEPFRGPSTVDEFAEVLECYDDPQQAAYPPDSGWSFSEYFFKTAYKNGWRLRDEAESGWRALMQGIGHNKQTEKVAVAMEYITQCIEFVLTEHMNFNSSRCPIKPEHWAQAVMESEVRGSMGFTVIPAEGPEVVEGDKENQP